MRVVLLLCVLLVGHLRTSRKRGSHNEKSHGTRAGFGADGPKARRARAADKGRKIVNPGGNLASIEDRIRSIPDHEEGAILSPDGEVLASKRGEANRIDWTPQEITLAKGAVLTHNHPTGQSFSPDDMRFLIEHSLDEIRAVTPEYTYTARVKPDAPGGASYMQQAIKSRVPKAMKKQKAEDVKNIRAGKLDPKQASADYWHNIWSRVAPMADIDYKREAR